jgi:DNA repair protein RadD
MSAPELRTYQRGVIARIYQEIEDGKRRVIVVMPTGSGKTVVIADFINTEVARGHRVLVLAHRRELIQQTVAKLFAVGVDAGIVQAGFPPRPDEHVQVASVSTLHARAVRSSVMETPPADVIVVDEAHHVRARTYRQIIKLYSDAIVIGLTATPCRGDGRGLGPSFDTMIEGPSVAELTQAGHLVPTRIYAPPPPDLSGVQVARGDYVESALAAVVDKPELVGDVVTHWLRHADRRPTLLFATGINHARHCCDELRRAGVLAEHLDGGTPPEERDAILAGFVAGRVEVICNCAVLTEGVDMPAASCLVLARPTKSLGLYRQMVGRVLRPAPGKTDALILDHAGAVFAHGFPDDPIEWTLAEDRRAVNKAHAARLTYRAPRLTNCPECSAVRFEGKPCTACGWRPRAKPVAVEVAEGDLGEVDRSRRVAGAGLDRNRFHGMLAHIGRERGYAAGWAAHKFKEKFGEWPPTRYPIPVPPDDATRAWVRSRIIAYAKAREKAGAA